MGQLSNTGPLDPRRFFSAAEVTAVWLRQDRRCAECRRQVPRDLVEGDHIHAWTSGGRTDIDNLQVLCVACNRRKGRRVGVVGPISTPQVAVADGPLRAWQQAAVALVIEQREPLLIEACPGAGKTRFALEAAAQLFNRGVINRLLVIAPTIRIVDQWVAAAAGEGGGATLPFAPSGWRPTQPLYDHWCGAAFTYQSLFMQSTMFEALAAEPGYSTLVIFDEVHHVGTESGWGIGAQQAFMHSATRILSLSGTPFRTKDAIVFVRTIEGRAVPDFQYGYGQALEDRCCRPVRFAFVGGETTFQTPVGTVETVSFADDLNELGESYRLRTALDVSGGHLSEMLRLANDELVRLRAGGDTDAGGLVVCMDCDHADAVAELLTRRSGLRPTVACSRLNNPDDPAPRPAIENFCDGASPWLVAVRMVSEGVDIRRLRVLVYATNVVAELTFRQVVGRVVRSDGNNGDADYGVVILPSDPRLLAMAERIRQEAPARIEALLVIGDDLPRTISLAEPGPYGEFQPIASTGELSIVTDVDGRTAPAELVAAAERYVLTTGSVIPPFELALAASTDDELRQILLMRATDGTSSVDC